MSEKETPESNTTWADSLRDHLVWFMLAIVIGLGSSYIAMEVNIAKLQTNIAIADSRISKVEERLDRRRNRTVKLRIQLTRLEEKIDLLLLNNGIEPEAKQNEN